MVRDCPATLLHLPLDIREQIYHHVLFDDLDPTPVDTGVRRRHLFRVKPFNVPPTRPNRCALASHPADLLRVCRQVGQEAAKQLYNSLFVDLNISFDEERAHVFLESIGPANRALIRYMRLRCFFVDFALPSCIWNSMVHLVQRDCAALEKLTLVYPASALHEPDGRPPALQQESWLRDTLAMAQRLRVDLQREDEGLLFNPAGLRTAFAVCGAPPQVAGGGAGQADGAAVMGVPPASFAGWGRLPADVQRRVIRHAVLPEHDIIHPTLRVGTSLEARTILPLMLTSRALHALTQRVCYSDAIFASCCAHERMPFIGFMRSRTEEQMKLLRRWFCKGVEYFGRDRGFSKYMNNHTTAVNLEPLFKNRSYRHACLEATMADYIEWRRDVEVAVQGDDF